MAGVPRYGLLGLAPRGALGLAPDYDLRHGSGGMLGLAGAAERPELRTSPPAPVMNALRDALRWAGYAPDPFLRDADMVAPISSAANYTDALLRHDLPAAVSEAPWLAMAMMPGPPGKGTIARKVARTGEEWLRAIQEAPTWYHETNQDIHEFLPGSFWAADPANAGAGGKSGAKAVYDAKLAPERVFRQDLSLQDFNDILSAVEADPKYFGEGTAEQMARALIQSDRPGESSLATLRRAIEQGQATTVPGDLVLRMIKLRANGALERAGFDAIDWADGTRQMLGGQNIRSPRARFDPSQRHSRDILSSLPMREPVA